MFNAIHAAMLSVMEGTGVSGRFGSEGKRVPVIRYRRVLGAGSDDRCNTAEGSGYI